MEDEPAPPPRRNVVVASIIVGLPVIASLVVLGLLIWRAFPNAWAWGFLAMLLGVLAEYPYLKICDRYFFK